MADWETIRTSKAWADANLPVLIEPESETVTCLVCEGEADGECLICGAPLCDDDSRFHDYDRYCPGERCLL